MADYPTPRTGDDDRGGRQTAKVIEIVALILLIVGAINWGLVGLFQFDLVAALFGGSGALISRIVYVLVGIAGVYEAIAFPALRKRYLATRGTTGTVTGERY